MIEWGIILQELFTVVLIPLLGIVTKYLVDFIKAKIRQISDDSNNELTKKYLSLLEDTVTNCVIATNQTYVNALKDRNAFTVEAQKEAFKKTYESVMSILSEDAIKYLDTTLGDTEVYVKMLIESAVHQNRV